MKLFILPNFRGEDSGDGGIRRVVEAQRQHLPTYGIECVNTPEEADVIAVHAGLWTDTDKPVVTHCHGLYWNEYQWMNWAIGMNKQVIDAMHKADMVTAPSEWIANILRRGMWLNPIILGHGVDINDWVPGSNEGYVLWNKTRTDPVCDPVHLDELANRALDTKFVTTFGQVGPNVNVTGKLPFWEAKQHIQNAGVYLCTSRETFGIGTLEAMACGVPILAFNWGGQREFVKHKVHGYLAAPYNYDDLLQGLYYCIEHRTELGQAARACVQNEHTWQKVMGKYASMYRALAMRPNYTPKVSIVIPCYKLEQYLPDAVNSILNQEDFDDLEIIIVDDASPTWNEAKLPGDARIHVIHNETNQYLAGSLNTGVATAKGKYILPLDADNMIGPRTLRVLSEALDKDRNLDITYGKILFVHEDGHTPDGTVSPDGISTWPPAKFDFRYQMMHRNQVPSTSMYRRQVWQRAGGYRKRCLTAEDADFWCRTTRLGFRPAQVTDAVTFIYRQRQGSMSRVQSDWAWNDWYPEAHNTQATPFGVEGMHNNVPTYEPTLVSVVIPCGPGHQEYVLDAVDSVVSQSFQQWECIVVNDTGAPLPWIHPFVRLVNTSGGTGPANARNEGIKEARAKAVILLDADDYLQPNAIELLYDTYKRNGGYVYSDFFAQGEIKHTPDYSCESVLRNMPHPIIGLYPRDAAKFDATIDAWEDWDYLISLNVAGYCGTRVPVPLFHYRFNTGNRREAFYARQDDIKEAVRAKWYDYIHGGRQLMACSSCPGGGGGQWAGSSSSIVAPDGDAVMLEFVGAHNEPRSYRGSSGRTYRFGGDSGHKMKFVLKGDIEGLVQKGIFKVYETAQSMQPLVAN